MKGKITRKELDAALRIICQHGTGTTLIADAKIVGISWACLAPSGKLLKESAVQQSIKLLGDAISEGMK